jgi:glycosyltransferase involved in cell wall biosynthesis
MRQDHGIDEASIVLSVVGKLAPWKNQDHIIDAMKKLEARGICLHLFILGSGQMMEAWQIKAKELSKSKVHFPGFVNINELPAYYANTDIYVHPASVEPHSIAISEAIYMGCPVIISDRCGSYGINDDVQEKRNGYVYSYGDIEQLAAAIEMLSENEQLKNSYGQYSHQIAVQFQNIAHRHTLQELVNKIVLKNKNKTGYELGGV